MGNNVSRRDALTVLAATTLLVTQACATASPVSPADPSYFDAEVAIWSKTQPPRGRTLFIGSSSIRLWTSLERDMSPREVLNRGFGGAQTVHMNRHFESIIAPAMPSAIVFYCGENDLFAGKGVADVLREFERFLELRDRHLPGTEVYFISVKPSPARLHQLAEQAALNAGVKALADTAPALTYIDVATPMIGQDGIPLPVFIDDGLHMNAGGYAIWTREVRRVLGIGEQAGASAILPN